jgi:glutamine synthetase
VPATLRDAVDAFERSAVATEAFGKDVVRHYTHAGRTELASYERAVTDWERRRGFERL